MIVAVVDAARGDGRAPMELQMAWMCGDANLPEAGGVLDQDAGLMARMRACVNIYQAFTRLAGASGSQIHQLTDRERRIIRGLREGGYL
jgi:hypothetical protein